MFPHVRAISLCCKPDIGVHVYLVKSLTHPVCREPELNQLSTVLSSVEQGAKLSSFAYGMTVKADMVSAVISSSNTDSLFAEVLLKQLSKPDYSLERNF